MNTAALRQSILMPQFDWRSTAAYSILALMLCLGGVLVVARGFTLSAIVFKALPLTCLWIVSAGLLRRIEWPRVATWLEASAIAYGHGIPAFMILSPAASFALPTVDPYLAAADKALGLDWVATVYALQPYLRPLKFAYFSFAWQPSLAVFLLAFFHSTRCWQYVTAGVGCGLVTGIAFIFFPAYGAFIHYGITPEQYAPFTYTSSPWSWLPAFEKLRHGYSIIDPSVATALVSFPSYHAAASVLTVWALWPFRFLRLPVVVLNCGLLAGALIFGTHHFIDLIAGGLIAIVAIVLVKRWVTESIE